MLTQYRLTLTPEGPCAPQAEWGYRLYAALLEQAPGAFGEEVHQDAVTPLSQHLTVGEDRLIWTVNLLGERSEAALARLLEGQASILLKRDRVRIFITGCRREGVEDVEALFALAARQQGPHLLQFQTPTAFKSRGEYVNLPTPRLIVQSLVQKWNGCFPDCPIEDEDGQGVEAIAAGLRCRGFRLQDRTYYLKGSAIPGFVGELTLENRLSGFHRQLADVLLLFSGYSGVGIKTALGMGGVRRQPARRG